MRGHNPRYARHFFGENRAFAPNPLSSLQIRCFLAKDAHLESELMEPRELSYDSPFPLRLLIAIERNKASDLNNLILWHVSIVVSHVSVFPSEIQ